MAKPKSVRRRKQREKAKALAAKEKAEQELDQEQSPEDMEDAEDSGIGVESVSAVSEDGGVDVSYDDGNETAEPITLQPTTPPAKKAKRKKGKKKNRADDPEATPTPHEHRPSADEEHTSEEADPQLGSPKKSKRKQAKKQKGFYDSDATTTQHYSPPSADEDRTSDETELPQADPHFVHVTNWLEAKRGVHPFRNTSRAGCEAIIKFFYERTVPDKDEDAWKQSVRHTIWRAVVRANFWWVDPSSGQATGKPRPLKVPEGVNESNFELFVVCAAERLDRVGRDLPDPDYVKKVEDEVRGLVSRQDEESLGILFERLAFTMLLYEKQKNVVPLEEMQEALRRIFEDIEVEGDATVFKKGPVEKQKIAAGSNVAIAEMIWDQALAEL